jgi:hypothetical protein
MTPAAMTPAAQETSKGRRTGAQDGTGSVPGHRHHGRAPVSPRPRRVSGPISGHSGAGVPASTPTTRTAAPPRPGTKRRPLVPRIPRRVSGPVPRGQLGPRLVALVRALPDHQLLDRLIRGRTWIALLGVMLVGIVAMQVEVLKLGASMGRFIDQGTYLQGRNESLRATVAALADDQRIERLAAQRGMVMPAPSDVGFLSAGSGAAVQKAISNIHTPDSSSFLNQPAGNGAVTTGANSTAPDTASASSGASTTGGAVTGSGASTASGAPTSSSPAGSGTSSLSGSTGTSSSPSASTSSSPAVSTGASASSPTAASLASGGAAGGAGGG